MTAFSLVIKYALVMDGSMYYIYEIPGVKIGCTQDMERRQKEQRDKGKMVLLETHTNIEDASRRERELQLTKGYSVDISNYALAVRNSNTVCQTPQAIKKRVFKFKEQHRVKGWGKELIKVYKASVLREGSFWKTYKGDYIGTYEGIDSIVKQFNLRHRQGVSNVLRKLNGAKSYRGFTFEYA